jgi:hypothetical protein
MLAFILLGGEARAWGDLGHKVICEIAFRLVQPDTQAAINRLMQLDSEFKPFRTPASIRTIRAYVRPSIS